MRTARGDRMNSGDEGHFQGRIDYSEGRTKSEATVQQVPIMRHRFGDAARGHLQKVLAGRPRYAPSRKTSHLDSERT